MIAQCKTFWPTEAVEHVNTKNSTIRCNFFHVGHVHKITVRETVTFSFLTYGLSYSQTNS